MSKVTLLSNNLCTIPCIHAKLLVSTIVVQEIHNNDIMYIQFSYENLILHISKIFLPTYDVFISQPIRYARACASYGYYSKGNLTFKLPSLRGIRQGTFEIVIEVVL